MLLIRADFEITSLSNNLHIIRVSVHWYISLGIGQFQQRAEPRHTAVYWPGLQGLVSDPLAWRARLHTFITFKYEHCTFQPPADVSLPFPGHCRGGFDSCACLLSRQENHRAEVKKHVLLNVSPFVTACPESRLKRFSRRGSPTGRNLKNA
ncbi:hypothetical protein ALC57_03713 [Trachymyrmex cornetzi]|uniref:Uncharacterized protein n=1 Tax=Trachymyrmex cornetzi TaxID=471704 RepID=A0A151JLX6_9HYME|nr:hypothetical protein ALC57_03713 [Trachymyrmex cornetzi]